MDKRLFKAHLEKMVEDAKEVQQMLMSKKAIALHKKRPEPKPETVGGTLATDPTDAEINHISLLIAAESGKLELLEKLLKDVAKWQK
jgi:hypothetical protein